MTLIKTYALACEGPSLLMYRERVAGKTHAEIRVDRSGRDALRAKCAMVAPTEVSSQKTRATARRLGWVRHSERFPIYQGATDTSVHRFDLCPSCHAALSEPAPLAPSALPGEETPPAEPAICGDEIPWTANPCQDCRLPVRTASSSG
jgi:hypothetical protein